MWTTKSCYQCFDMNNRSSHYEWSGSVSPERRPQTSGVCPAWSWSPECHRPVWCESSIGRPTARQATQQPEHTHTYIYRSPSPQYSKYCIEVYVCVLPVKRLLHIWTVEPSVASSASSHPPCPHTWNTHTDIAAFITALMWKCLMIYLWVLPLVLKNGTWEKVMGSLKFHPQDGDRDIWWKSDQCLIDNQ